MYRNAIKCERCFFLKQNVFHYVLRFGRDATTAIYVYSIYTAAASNNPPVPEDALLNGNNIILRSDLAVLYTFIHTSISIPQSV